MKRELLRHRAGEKSWQRHRLVKRLLAHRPGSQATEEALGRLVENCCQMERDLSDMKRSLENMALFYNGRQIPWERLVYGKGGFDVEAGYAGE